MYAPMVCLHTTQRQYNFNVGLAFCRSEVLFMSKGIAVHAAILLKIHCSSSTLARGGDEGSEDVQLHAVEAGVNCVQRSPIGNFRLRAYRMEDV